MYAVDLVEDADDGVHARVIAVVRGLLFFERLEGEDVLAASAGKGALACDNRMSTCRSMRDAETRQIRNV